MEASQSSKLRDGVRLLGGVLANKNCLRGVVDAHDSAKVEDQVRFLAGTLSDVRDDLRQAASTGRAWAYLSRATKNEPPMIFPSVVQSKKWP